MNLYPKGNSLSGTKKAFLEQKKREKQQKEEFKVKTLAAQRIQCFWRFKRQRQAQFSIILSEYNKKMRDVKTVMAKLTEKQLSDLSNKILVLYSVFFDTLEFLHARNCVTYQSIISDLAGILLNAGSLSVMNTFEGKQSKYPQIYRIVTLSLCLLSQLQESEKSGELFKQLDAFLTVFFRNCKKTAKKVSIPSCYFLPLLESSSSFTSKGVKKCIKNACFNTKSKQVIWKCLLTESSMKQILNEKCQRAQIVFEAIAQEKQEETNQVKDSEKLRIKVANYIEIWRLIDSNIQMENVLQQFSIILMGNLEKLIRQTKEIEQMQLSSQMEEEEQPITDSMLDIEEEEESSQTNTKTTLFYKQYSSTLDKLNLAEFSTPKSIQLFYKMITNLASAKPLPPSNLDKISQICGQFLMMSKIRNQYQLGLKIKLAQSFPLLYALFQLVQILGFDIDKFRQYSKILANVIELFCVLLKKRLSLIDDEEFFYSMGLGPEVILITPNLLAAENFTRAEMKQLIDFLNVFAFKILFVESHSDYKRCESKVVKLLKQLYCRDQRRQFYGNWVLQNNECHKQLTNFDFRKIKNGQNLDESNSYMARLLNQIPHIFTFEERYNKMKSFIQEDQSHQDRNPFQFYNQNDQDDDENDQHPNILALNSKNIIIKRGDELNEAFSKFHSKNMKALYKITFVDEHGFMEEGIDGGGIIKEFVNSVVRQGFDPQNGLFIETAEHTLMPAPNNKGKFARYVFLGKIVGKAIYEDILIEPVFSKVFLNQILEKPSTLEDLQFIDKALYKTLMNLKHTTDNVEDYGLFFSIYDSYNGVIELKQNGGNIPVTNENKFEYISLYAEYKLNQMNYFEANAFKQGFASVIDQEWLSMFNHDELQLIISGKFTCFDIIDLRKNTNYKGYHENDLTIVLFWEILESFTAEEKAKFLHFVTSCSRPPTLGFKQLNPKFCIQLSTDDSSPNFPNKLPTSSTCMNILKLPDYKDPSKLKAKLLEAIYSGAGFDLS